MNHVDPSVLADWGAWTAQFEGRVAYMYLDTKGLVTVGLGCLIDPVSLALDLPWLCDDGLPASAHSIDVEWQRVKAMPAGLLFTHYRGELHLAEEAIDDLARTRIQQDAEILARYFPDFAAFPPPAQRALLSMAWAMGPGFPAKWPHFSAAVRVQDWASAAASCKIDETGEPGVVPRNRANRELLLAAVDVATTMGETL